MNTLHAETLALVKEERRLTGLVIENLQKISDTKLYLKMGYSSLFQYCTKALGYAEASAYRRIEAVKVARIIPEVKEKLNSGALNLSNLAMAQNFFNNTQATLEEKKQAIEKIEGCSKRETEKVLADFFAVAPPAAAKEKVRHFRSGEAALQIHLPEEVLQKLDRIKSLRSHKNSNMSYADVIKDMCELVLKKIDPMEKAQSCAKEKQKSAEATKSHVENSKSQSSKNPRYIPAKIKTTVWKRDAGQCTFKDTKTGRRCDSKHLLQLDHATPLFLGGNTSPQNLRLLCHAHHRLRDREFGAIF